MKLITCVTNGVTVGNDVIISTVCLQILTDELRFWTPADESLAFDEFSATSRTWQWLSVCPVEFLVMVRIQISGAAAILSYA